MGFNPTLVRLKQQSLTAWTATADGFQSHFGSIKTLKYHYSDLLRIMFQSHFGSIKTL